MLPPPPRSCPLTCHDGHLAAQVQISRGTAVVSTGGRRAQGAVRRGSSGAMLRAQCALLLGQAGRVVCTPQTHKQDTTPEAHERARLDAALEGADEAEAMVEQVVQPVHGGVLGAEDDVIADLVVLAGCWVEEHLFSVPCASLCSPGGHTNPHFTSLTSPG